MDLHPITAESFAVIDREVGVHSWSDHEYAIVRRAIHATADFDLNNLFSFSPGAIAAGTRALREKRPVVVDVRMVSVGIESTLARIGYQRVHCALDYAVLHSPTVEAQETHQAGTLTAAQQAEPRSVAPTRTAAGMRYLAQQYPQALFVIGNAPTALLALVEDIRATKVCPALVIGVPVGFVAVIEAKQALAALDVPQIQVTGRKGGSAIAAAIVNALAHLSAESTGS